MHSATANSPGDGAFNGAFNGAFKSIGFFARHEVLAWELAKAFNDPAGIAYYRSCCRTYPEDLIRRSLNEVSRVPAATVKKGRIALFAHLLKTYAKGTAEDSSR